MNVFLGDKTGFVRLGHTLSIICYAVLNNLPVEVNITTYSTAQLKLDNCIAKL